LISALASPFSAKSGPSGRSKIYIGSIDYAFYAGSVTNQSQFGHGEIGAKFEEKATSMIEETSNNPP
jgi:Golgi nucleoside diphosphatase